MYYHPGSIVKPMILAAALADGKVSPGEHITCAGRLFSESPGFGCTGTHGSIDPILAIKQSCNVFFYKTGERMGVSRLNEWLRQFGLGEPAGTGLPGEMRGNLPRIQTAGEARFLGIGQGGIDVTPAQAVNMIATVATGIYRPLALQAQAPDTEPQRRLPIPEQHWRLVREGMYEAVNTPRGTAYASQDPLKDAGEYVLLGKTGSSEPPRRTIESLFTCHFPDGEVREIAGRSPQEIRSKHPEARITGRRWHRRWPDVDPLPTHAWFVGYLAPRDRYQHPITEEHGGVAIAVVIEYSGHGGAVAAPVAKQMMQSWLLWKQNRLQAN
jgi:penicillin-binding protein 2